MPILAVVFCIAPEARRRERYKNPGTLVVTKPTRLRALPAHYSEHGVEVGLLAVAVGDGSTADLPLPFMQQYGSKKAGAFVLSVIGPNSS